LIHVLRSDTLFDRETDFKELSESFAVSAEPGVSAALKEAAGRLVAAGFEEDRVAWKVLRGSSSRAGTIVEVAEKEDFGTIVVGRRGLSRVREFSLGRVGNKVVHLGRSHTVWVVS
jgi:nucleotide-binding universal stress UspA family protein